MRHVLARAARENLLCKPALALALSLFTISVCAAAPTAACNRDLRQLIAPALKGVFMNSKDVQTEVDDNNGGVYSVRLFVGANSPDNLDRQVSIGWINLDVNAMKVFDVTNDPDSPVALDVSEEKYAAFVKKCLR
jgi:hypothetical protein